MQTDKYTKVILTLIAIGLFSLGCGGGASLEEVNELRQEIAELQQEIADLKEVVEQGNSDVSDVVRTRKLEVVNSDGRPVLMAAASPSEGHGSFNILNNSGRNILFAGTHPKSLEKGGDGVLYISDRRGGRLIYAGVGQNKNGGAVAVINKSGGAAITLGVDDYGNGEVGGFNR